METKKTPAKRTVKKTATPVTPEVKLQETHQAKRYDRNSGDTTGAAIRIICMVILIIGAYFVGVRMGLGEYQASLTKVSEVEADPMIEHCRLMPDMPQCASYNQLGMDHTPMDMSMREMSAMLQGKTGTGLEKAFLEAMIPHHEGALLMARYLTGNINPELIKMGEEITSSQQKEIDQMKQWIIDWGYSENGTQTPPEKIAL